MADVWLETYLINPQWNPIEVIIPEKLPDKPPSEGISRKSLRP
jgi:hypothetical protein